MTIHSRHGVEDHINLAFEIFIAVLTLTPILILCYFYPSLPDQIPEYLTWKGEIETTSAKSVPAVFRLSLMGIDLQVLCLLMKYGIAQSVPTSSTRNSEQFFFQEQILNASGKLWNWFRVLIAVKFGASSLDTIFLTSQGLHLFSLSVRVLSITSAILGIGGVLFYGYRLLVVNRKSQQNKRASRKGQVDQAHVYGRVLYYDSGDPRLFNEKYLLNFANKWSYVLLACVIILPLLMFHPMLVSIYSDF